MHLCTHLGIHKTPHTKNQHQDHKQAQMTPGNSVPDLVVDSFEFDPAFPKAGERVFMDITVKNQGAGAASAFQVGLDGTGFPLREKKLDFLEPQGEKTVRFGPVTMKPGSYSYTATADSRHEVTESEEGNNWQYTWLNIDDPFPPRV